MLHVAAQGWRGGSCYVRADQCMQGIVDAKWFYNLFFVHTQTPLLAKRHGPAWSIQGQFFSPISILYPSKDNKLINLLVDFNGKILTAGLLFLFKSAWIVKTKRGTLLFNKLRAAAQALLRSKQSFWYLSFRIWEHSWAWTGVWNPPHFGVIMLVLLHVVAQYPLWQKKHQKWELQ